MTSKRRENINLVSFICLSFNVIIFPLILNYILYDRYIPIQTPIITLLRNVMLTVLRELRLPVVAVPPFSPLSRVRRYIETVFDRVTNPSNFVKSVSLYVSHMFNSLLRVENCDLKHNRSCFMHNFKYLKPCTDVLWDSIKTFSDVQKIRSLCKAKTSVVYLTVRAYVYL